MSVEAGSLVACTSTDGKDEFKLAQAAPLAPGYGHTSSVSTSCKSKCIRYHSWKVRVSGACEKIAVGLMDATCGAVFVPDAATGWSIVAAWCDGIDIVFINSQAWCKRRHSASAGPSMDAVSSRWTAR